ncbi:LysR family transcriptional regulator [Selenomonas artemidis]|nr:LysR family transcriptional regulator [Selenomonas artemidis]
MLRTMLVLARLKSFSKTAIEMNLSQSTISARVADLERELDRKMFTRNHHSVALTPAGSIFLPYAKKAVHDYEQGRWHINAIETFDDRLAIGNVNSALGNFLLPVYVDFMRAYPRISIHAAIGHSSDILQQLADGLIDVAISYRLPKSKKIRSWICVDEDFVFVVGRKDPLAEYESIHVKGLAITNLIMQDWGGAFSEWFHSIIPANRFSGCYMSSTPALAHLYVDRRQTAAPAGNRKMDRCYEE